MTPFISSRVRKLDVGISGYTDSDSVLNVTGKVSIGTEIDIVPYDTVNNGTLRLEASAGTLFSVSNNLTSGSIFSVNDVSGIPSFDVNADGTVLLAPFGSTEYVGIGTNSPAYKLDVIGDVNISASNAYKIGTGSVVYYSGGVTKFSDLGGGLSLDTGNTERLFIDTNGNVGIGTTSPATLTEIKSTTTNAARLRVTGTGTTAGNFRGYEFGDGSLFKGGLLQDESTDLISIFTPFGGQSINITSAGSLGVGTTSPGANLEVSSGSNTTTRINCNATYASILEFTQNADRKALIRRLNGGEFDIINEFGDLRFWTASDGTELQRLVIDSSGNVGVGTSSPSALAHVSASYAAPSTGGIDSNTRLIVSNNNVASGEANISLLYRSNAKGRLNFGSQIVEDVAYIEGGVNYLAFGTGSGSASADERLRITSDGKVGIGTASPGRILQINSGAVNNSYVRFTNNNSTANGAEVGLFDNGVADPSLILANTMSDGNIIMTAGGTERLRITSDGKVGVGTTSPTDALQVANGNILIGTGGSSAGYRALYFGSSASASARFAYIEKNNDTPYDFNIVAQTSTTAASAINFKTTPTSTAATIDSSGRLLVGTSSSVNDTFGAANLQISASTTNIASFARYSDNAFLPTVVIKKSRGAIGAQGLLSSQDALGGIQFEGSDGAGFIRGAAIYAYVDGTPGANDMPGRLVFATTASGASSPTERMRITSDGKVGVGTSSPAYLLDVRRSSAGDVVAFTGSADGGRPLEFASADNGIFLGAQWTRNVSSGGGIHAWAINGIERARIDSSGRLLVGTTSAASTSQLQVFSGADGRSVFRHVSGDGGVTLTGSGPGSAASLVFGNNWNSDDGANFSEEYRIFMNGANDALEFKYNNNTSTAMVLDSAGRLGVGTSSPDTLTHLAASSGATLRIEALTANLAQDTVVGNIEFEANDASAQGTGVKASIGAYSDLAAGNQVSLRLHAGAQSEVTGTERYRISGDGQHIFGGVGGISTAERVRIDSSGNVGIGTSSPVTQLHIQKATGGLAGVQISTSTHGSTLTDGLFVGIDNSIGYLYNYEDLPLVFGTNSTERMRITSSGNVGVGTTNPLSTLHLSNAGAEGMEIYIANAANINVIQHYNRSGAAYVTHRNVALDHRFESSGTEALRINSSANVGIGTQNPTEKLEVSGNIKLSSNGTGASASSYDLLFYGTSSTSVQKNQAKISSSPGTSNTNAGELKFFTNSSTNVVTERMRIDGEGNVGIATTNPQYKLDIVGTLRVSETTRIGDVIDIVPYDNLDNGTLSFEGSAGQLFSITNNLTSGSIFAVNDVSGIPSIDVDADGTVSLAEFGGNVGIGTGSPAAKLDVNGDIFPTTDATHDLGSPSKRWNNVYTTDLQLSNEGSANEVDGTWGQYTIQEGEEDLYLINRRSGKKYKFVLQEVK